EQGLKCQLEYNTDLFDSSTIVRLGMHWQNLLESVCTEPVRRLSQLPLLTAAERRQLLSEWNDVGANYPQSDCIHELFERQVVRRPDSVAVTFDNEQITYRELNGRANQLAHYLRAKGVGPDTTIGLFLERSPEMVVALLAILKAGGGYVPFDQSQGIER